MQKVLVPHRSGIPNWDDHRDAWSSRSIEFLLAPEGFRQMPEPERIQHLQDITAVVAATERYTEHVFASCPSLRIIARSGVGYDSVDLDAATRHGIWVTTTPGAPDQTVAETTWMLILAVVRQLENYLQSMRGGVWDRRLPPEVSGKTLGIIGTGRIGRRVALIARGFDMKLLGCAKRPDTDFAASVGLQYVELRELLSQSDIVTIHTPRTPQTVHLINAETLGWMKPTAYLVNTARGAIIDEPALAKALGEGRLAGAALDVFEHEPLPADSPLRRLPNLMLTPHMGSVTQEAHRRIYTQAMDNILAVLDGRRPPNPLNEAGQRRE